MSIVKIDMPLYRKIKVLNLRRKYNEANIIMEGYGSLENIGQELSVGRIAEPKPATIK